MNDPHAAEEALQIFRQVVVRRQAELVEEDVDEEEHEEESEEEVYVPVSRFLPVAAYADVPGVPGWENWALPVRSEVHVRSSSE